MLRARHDLNVIPPRGGGSITYFHGFLSCSVFGIFNNIINVTIIASSIITMLISVIPTMSGFSVCFDAMPVKAQTTTSP